MATVATSRLTRIGSVDGFLGGWQIAGITAAQTGEAVNAVMSNDLSNTGSFSYRPNQVANPVQFLLQYRVAGNRSMAAPIRDTRLWIAGQPSGIRRAPSGLRAAIRAQLSAMPRSEICVARTWWTSTWFCKRTSKFWSRTRSSSASEFFNLFNHPNFGLPGGGSSAPVDVPGGAAITNTATDNRQIEFALKYTF